MIWIELSVAETNSVGFCWVLFLTKHWTFAKCTSKHDIFQVRAEVWTNLPTQLSRFEVKHTTERFVEGSWTFSLWMFQPSSWSSLRLGRPDSEEGWKNEDWVSTLVGSTSNRSVSFAIFISVGNGLLKGEITLVREKLWRKNSMGPISRLAVLQKLFRAYCSRKRGALREHVGELWGRLSAALARSVARQLCLLSPSVWIGWVGRLVIHSHYLFSSPPSFLLPFPPFSFWRVCMSQVCLAYLSLPYVLPHLISLHSVFIVITDWLSSLGGPVCFSLLCAHHIDILFQPTLFFDVLLLYSKCMYNK